MSSPRARRSPGSFPAELADGELARRIAAADRSPATSEEAELCRRYARRLLAFSRRQLGGDRARDLAQDTLVLTLEKLRAGQVREPEKIGSFILGVARSLARDYWRGDARTTPLADAAPDLLGTDAPDAAGDPIVQARVGPCVEQLPEKQRAVVLLSFYGERTSGEVAASLGLTPNHVRVLRHRGVAQLRQCLGIAPGGDAA